MSTDITYDGSILRTIFGGQKATLLCEGKKMVDDVVVSFGEAGTITYDGKVTPVSANKKATLICANQRMLSNVIIYAQSEVAGDVAGLYDANGNIVADWEQLISDGMDVVNTAYNANTALTNQASPYNVLSKYGNGKKLIISDSVTFLNQFSFYKCDTLTSVIIPDSVITFGVSVFRNCSNLASVTISNSVEVINNWLFGYCSSLTSVTIGNSVKTISNQAFFGCSSLTSIIIPEPVTTINANVFIDCISLTSVTIKATTPPTLSSATIFPTSNKGFTIYVPKGYGDVYKNYSTNWSNLANYIKEED